jgi:hypothetical protein
MWIVRNKLRATLKIEGTAIEIEPEQEVDLDIHGRDFVDELLPLAVAFEEGYLENVFKEAPQQVAPVTPVTQPVTITQGVTAVEMSSHLEDFKQSIIDELKQTIPSQNGEGMVSAILGQQIGAVQEELRAGVKGVLESLEAVQGRLSQEKAKIVSNPNLSRAEIRARLAFIEETERNIKTNFDRIGHVIESESDQSDVLGHADLLADI